MPARLVPSIKPHSSSPKSPGGRKKVASAIAGLALSRRGRSKKYAKSPPSSPSSRSLSRQASRILDDGDATDALQNAGGGAQAAGGGGRGGSDDARAVVRRDSCSSTHTIPEVDDARGGRDDVDMKCATVSPGGVPDDESRPTVEPKRLAVAQQRNESEDGAGNEALIFIYGPAPDLHADVFDVARDATPEEVQDSYRAQIEQLDVALSCPDRGGFQKQAAMLCGMTRDQSTYLHPRDYCMIKRDALTRAYDMLCAQREGGESGDECGVEGLDVWKEMADDGTVGTVSETTDSSSPGFWSEENTIYAGDVAYGDHGDYSYDCDDDKDGGLESYETSSTKEVDNRSTHSPMATEESNAKHYERDESSASQLDYSRMSSSASQLDYSYPSEDEYQEQDGFSEVSEEEEPFDCVTPRSQVRNKQEKDPPPGKQRSPTDPMEFDQLLQDSVDDNEYFNQFSSGPKSFSGKNRTAIEEEEAFDPFDLQGGNDNDDIMSQVTSDTFPESAIEEDTTFLCSLPSQEDDEEDENELTMGDYLNNMSYQFNDRSSSRGLDSLSLSESANGGSTLSRSSNGGSVGSNANRSTMSQKKKSKGSKMKRFLTNLSLSHSGSMSGSDASSRDESVASELLSIEGNVDDDHDLLPLSPGTAVSHLTDDFDGGNEDVTMPELDGVDELDCFDGRRGDTGKRNEKTSAKVDDVKTRGRDPDGINMSTDQPLGDQYVEEQALSRSLRKGKEDTEIESFLEITSKFSDMDSETNSVTSSRGSLRPSGSILRNSNRSSKKNDKEGGKKMSSAQKKSEQAIDCFPDEEDPAKIVRFHIEEDDDTHHSHVSCFDACIDGVDDTIHSVEKLCCCG